MAKASGSIDLKAYNSASQEATNYISYDPQTGLTVGQEDLDSKVVISGDGVKLYDENGNVGTEIKSGFVRVGRNDDGHTVIQEDGMDIYGGDGTELLAHIGYDDGNALSGTATAPFYTFGTRANGSEIGNYSLAEGKRITAKGYCSHAEGIDTKANLQYSHAEGSNTTADGVASHAEGTGTIASGTASHAEGHDTEAKGQHSHTEGWKTTANNLCSHAEGIGTVASSDYQHVQGKYNVDDSNSTYADIVGWGSTDTSRRNIFALSTNGDGRYSGDVYVKCATNSTGGRKLVSASVDDGSGTKSNVATGTTFKNLTSVTLSDAGVYLLLGLARFPANANGRRGLAWGSSTTGYFDNSLVVVPPVTESNGITRIQSMTIVTVASSLNVYLNCYHTAGSSLNIEYYWRYIKLA